MTGSPAASEAVEQCRAELDWVAWRLYSLGLRFANPADLAAASQLKALSAVLVDQLAQEDDDRLSAQTVLDLMVVLWPHGSPETVGEVDHRHRRGLAA